MNKQNSFPKFKSFLIIAVCCLISTVSVFADNEKNQLLVVQNLSKKLQNDLSNSKVEVKLNHVEQSKLSKNEIEIKGDATCILADETDTLPIRFEAKVDSVNQNVLDVKYDFVEAPSSFAPSSNEEILMKELMSKIKNDYKTENIVIAIDTVENVESTRDQEKFLGYGEVRIGDFVWSKIKFDVVLDGQTQKANSIIYKVEK